MPLLRVSGTKGSIQDIVRLQALSDEPCNVLLVSDRTLYLLANFALNEVGWITRYYDYITGVFYNYPLESSPDGELVQDIANRFNLEVTPMGTLDGVIEAINNVAGAILSSACGCPVGEAPDTGEGVQGGSVPGDIGSVSFGEPSAITDRKCVAANWIFDNYTTVITTLDDNNIDDMTEASIAIVITVVAAALGAALGGPFGALLGVVAGAYLGIASAVLVDGVDLNNLKAALAANQEDLVCALYTASTSTGAKTAFLDVLTTAGQSVPNVALMNAMLWNSILNILFFSANTGTEAELSTYVGTIDCADCVGSCELTYQLTIGGLPRGSGDLTIDGNPRTLTAAFEPASGFWYIAVNVGSIGNSNYATNCDNMPAACVDTADEAFEVEWTSASPDIVDSNWGLCINGVHSAGELAESTPTDVSWFELIGTASFTADITFSD